MASQSSSTLPPVVLVLVTVDEPPAPLAPVVVAGPPLLLAPPAPSVVEFAPKPPGPKPPGPMPPVVVAPLVELVTPWLPAAEPVVAVALVAVEPGDVVAVLPLVVEPAVVVPVGPGPPDPPVTLVWLAVVSSIPGVASSTCSEHPALSKIQGSECNVGHTRCRPSRERLKLDRRRASDGVTETRRKDELFTASSVFATEPSVGTKRPNLVRPVTAKHCSVGAVWDYLVALAIRSRCSPAVSVSFSRVGSNWKLSDLVAGTRRRVLRRLPRFTNPRPTSKCQMDFSAAADSSPSKARI